MIPLRITWIYEPEESLKFHQGRDDEFIAEIGQHASVSIPLIEGLLNEAAPPDGFILLNSTKFQTSLAACPPERQVDVASRLIPIGVSRSRIFERVLEPLSLAAVVDDVSHGAWKRSDRSNPGAFGPFGLREVGKLIGAGCVPSHEMAGGLPAPPYESARYCYFHSATHHGLPHLLADYLITLHRLRSDVGDS